jgi:hypothetical protein
MNIIKISPCIVLVILFCGLNFSILSNERCQFNHTKRSNFYGSNLKFVATRARNSCVCFVQAYKLKRFLKRRIEYNTKSSATFNPTIVMLTRSGVNLVNSGPEQQRQKTISLNVVQEPNAKSSNCNRRLPKHKL